MSRACRVHGPQGFLALSLQTAVHALRLVDDQDGPHGLDQVDRLLAAGLLVGIVDFIDVPLVDAPTVTTMIWIWELVAKFRT